MAIKGPLTTPVGGGIRSLNVALRKELDLYVCLRPVRWFKGVPSPVKHPEKVDMVIFRENTEDIYAGIEFEAGTPEEREVPQAAQGELPRRSYAKIRFPETSGIGIKPVSQEGTERLVRAAIQYALANDRKSVTLVHKGNIMKFTEGAFRNWGYDAGRDASSATGLHLAAVGATKAEGRSGRQCRAEGRAGAGQLLIKDVIADIIFCSRSSPAPSEYDVIATMNLNGDYLSDALAAQVGGIGIAPGGNINYDDRSRRVRGHPRHRAQVCRAQDKVNPGSLILSGEMMLRYMGWNEAADSDRRGAGGAIGQKTVTYDLHRLMENATLLKSWSLPKPSSKICNKKGGVERACAFNSP